MKQRARSRLQLLGAAHDLGPTRIQCASDGMIDLAKELRRECADKVRENGFGQAEQLVAVNAARMLESLVLTDRNLQAETMVGRVHWCANHRGEPRVDQGLATQHDEHAGTLWVCLRRMLNSTELAARAIRVSNSLCRMSPDGRLAFGQSPNST